MRCTENRFIRIMWRYTSSKSMAKKYQFREKSDIKGGSRKHGMSITECELQTEYKQIATT